MFISKWYPVSCNIFFDLEGWEGFGAEVSPVSWVIFRDDPLLTMVSIVGTEVETGDVSDIADILRLVGLIDVFELGFEGEDGRGGRALTV